MIISTWYRLAQGRLFLLQATTKFKTLDHAENTVDHTCKVAELLWRKLY